MTINGVIKNFALALILYIKCDYQVGTVINFAFDKMLKFFTILTIANCL